ncbi:MAG: 4-hydroxyproline epimerase [Alphaproteobacteria bacterium]|nr:4-hydroxyproline epimerase [Alphaproteobacteria bacterium]
MAHTFFCIDGHTCGGPVRLVTGGAPALKGANMSERRVHFIENFDWVRTALMYEPRGHDAMSGALLYPPLAADCDLGLVFIETTGSLPMCVHGTIGTTTMVLEHGLVSPREEGRLHIDAPAGHVVADYTMNGRHVEQVRLRNVASYLAASELRVECPELGELVMDIAYGGNFYAIIEEQPNYAGLDALSVDQILRYSPILRERINQAVDLVHPEIPSIRGLRHVMWTGRPHDAKAHKRNAVFYGQRGIDRSPCGTGTSARMAQLAAKGELKVGDRFVHESIIGSLFECEVEAATEVGNHAAILPIIGGWARVTGHNTIFVDQRDPYAHGFQVL